MIVSDQGWAAKGLVHDQLVATSNVVFSAGIRVTNQGLVNLQTRGLGLGNAMKEQNPLICETML